MTYATMPQTDTSRCLVCGERETRDAPFVAVLTPVRGQHHWMHPDCHAAHIERCAVERRVRL